MRETELLWLMIRDITMQIPFQAKQHLEMHLAMVTEVAVLGGI